MKRLGGLVDGHRQHVCDGPVQDLELQRPGVVSAPLQVGRVLKRLSAWQDEQFDANEPIPSTALATALCHIEAEAAHVVPLLAP